MKIPCRRWAKEPARSNLSKPRCAGALSALLSTATLVLMPKCPLCIATCLAATSGIGITVGAAGHLRTGAVIFCSAVLAFLSLQLAGRLLRPLKTQGTNQVEVRPSSASM